MLLWAPTWSRARRWPWCWPPATAPSLAPLPPRRDLNDRAPTAFETGVNSVSWLLIRFAAVMVPVVLFINGYTKGDWAEAFLFALSVAVGLTPEMLPMIVTSTLAKGAVVLSRRKVVVKRLDAIQNFGAMDVLCTDKTGTLTQDRIVLERHTDAFGQPCDEMLRFAYLNSHYQTGLKNLLDHAVLEDVELHTQMRGPRTTARSMRSPSTSSAAACPWWWPSATTTTS